MSTLLRVIRNTRAPTWASPGMWDRGGPKVGVQEAWWVSDLQGAGEGRPLR